MSQPHHAARFQHSLLYILAFGFFLLPPSVFGQLSQNSGINSSDTWVVFDLKTQTSVISNNVAPPLNQSDLPC
jgi:hypothetical protein